MRHTKDKNRQALIFDPTDKTVVSDSISPEFHSVSDQGFANVARILVAADPVLQESYNAALDGPI